MTTNTTAPAALFSAAELVEDLLGGIATDTEETIVEEVTVVAITPAQLAELADTLDAEEAPAVTDTTPADDRPAVTLTHFERTVTRPNGHEGAVVFATAEEADTFPQRMGDAGAAFSAYGEVTTVANTYHVGDEVVVRAFGQERCGTVTKLGRSRVTVEYPRNRAGRLHTRPFTAIEVAPRGGDVARLISPSAAH